MGSRPVAETSIEWTHRTWNPVRGCSRVSEGCRHCYAERMASRFAAPGKTFHGFAKASGTSGWTGRVELIYDKLREPRSIRKPQRIFVNSMSDLFHERLTDDQIDEVFVAMASAPWHTFQVLTKRASRMLEYFEHTASGSPRHAIVSETLKRRFGRYCEWPLKHVWLGVSVEDQRSAIERVPSLLRAPAATRFISAEPLLGPLALLLSEWGHCYHSGASGRDHLSSHRECASHLDLVIVGGESGPGARPFDVAWARAIVRQCREAGIACFVKQCGSNVRTRNDSLSTEHNPDVPTDWPEPEGGWGRIDENLDGYRDGYQGAPIRIYLKDRKGGDPAEWPEDLRVRQFPGESAGRER